MLQSPFRGLAVSCCRLERQRRAGSRAMSAIADQSSTVEIDASELVMQLIVDEALLKQPGWTMGPMMAQAAHATSAILAQTFEDANTRAYLSSANLPSMRKVVLKTASGTSLHTLSSLLNDAAAASPSVRFPSHHLWIEQPENIATVLAIAPNARPAALKKVLNKCSLLRT